MAELSPLRCRMIEDMSVRNLSPATQRSYLHAVSKFSRFFQRSPDHLDLDDVVRFLEAVPSLKNRTALTTAYAAGLRVSEVVALKFADIDSGRMVIRPRKTNGRTLRVAWLPPHKRRGRLATVQRSNVLAVGITWHIPPISRRNWNGKLLFDDGRQRAADVTGLPWVEIDFPEDVERAARDILPRLPG